LGIQDYSLPRRLREAEEKQGEYGDLVSQKKRLSQEERKARLGVVVHTCNPSYLGGIGRRTAA
jgi:hypothetical protein